MNSIVLFHANYHVIGTMRKRVLLLVSKKAFFDFLVLVAYPMFTCDH
jgi:hypothetical protein